MKPRLAVDVFEDLAFLDESLVGANEAARRTGFPSAHAMEKWLQRHERSDLWQRFKHRDPEGAHPSGSDRKAQRLMSIDIEDTITALLVRADQSDRTRTRSKAAKVRGLLDDLRSALSIEREEDARREKARKDIERLERELAAAKSALRGGSPASITVGDGISAAELRSWAKANGIDCPPMGRIPATVREAYEAADEAEAS